MRCPRNSKRGVMLFAPVGVGGCAVKIVPPLVITRRTLAEGLSLLEEVARELQPGPAAGKRERQALAGKHYRTRRNGKNG